MPNPTPIWQPPSRHALPAISAGWLPPLAVIVGAAVVAWPVLRSFRGGFSAVARAMGG